jgi:glutamyl-tRNA synthetase
LRQQGLDGPAVVGVLAASLGLVPPGSRLSALELQQQWSLEALRQQLSDASKT